MIHITLPDGSVRTFEQDQITPLEVAKNISNGLAKKAVVAKVDDQLCSLHQTITQDAAVGIYTFDDPEGRDTFRHSTSHILAQAVKPCSRAPSWVSGLLSKMAFIMTLTLNINLLHQIWN